MDLIPLPISLGKERDARPAAILIVSGGIVLHHDLIAYPPAEPDEVAALLANAIGAAAARGPRPSKLIVRHRQIAGPLQQKLPDGPAVEAGTLPELDEAANSLIAHLAGVPRDHPPTSAMSRTWRGWGLPAAAIAELFRAAADYYRARPWKLLENEELVRFESGSTTWYISVMGAGGEVFGIALYERLEDVLSILRGDGPPEALRRMTGMCLSLTFDRRQDLPPVMGKEILAAGWEVAAPEAYPSLITFNLPGGGITRQFASDLVAVLRGVTGLVRHLKATRGDGGALPPWRDPVSGAELTLLEVDS